MWAGSVKLLFTVAFLASCACQAYAQNTVDNPASEGQAAQSQAGVTTPDQQPGFMPGNTASAPVAAPEQQPTQQLQAVTPEASENADENIGANDVAAQNIAQQQNDEIPIQATPVSGFSTQDTGASPVVSQQPGMMAPQMQMQPQMQAQPQMQPQMPYPDMNSGINMDLNPNMVGGYDPNMPPAAVVPYEVQLQQRNEDIQRQAREQAFERVKRSALPMETYEIRDVLGRLKDTQEAVQTPTRPAPSPNNVIRTISTDPSATPHTIRLHAGNVTTLNIIDVTGEPWPIVDLGFGGHFDVKPPEPGGHVIRITPLKDFAHGNLVVRLLKMTTPITFSLNSGGDEVNYRFDARIPEYGPNARMPLIDEGISTIAGDKTTTSFLEGVPPRGAKRLVVEGDVDARTSAYRYAGALYVRTPLSLLSPAWIGSTTSADGMNVYVLDDAPILLLSDRGALVRARVGEEAKEFKE